jgi:hypothetical protein
MIQDSDIFNNHLWTEAIQRILKFVGHRIAEQRCETVEAIMYEYLLAGNGLLLRATREEFTASLPIAFREVKGLRETFVGLRWHRPRITSAIWDEILMHAKNSHTAADFKENVYLIFWDKVRAMWRWRAAGKNNTWAATIADDQLPEYADACIELHTHPPGALNFSGADDKDESGKFRIFGILVDVHDKPKIRFRCGIYDQFIQIPASWISVLPKGIVDLNEIESLLQMML